ncbi:hypothetical protein B0T19DRAFT_442760 [Cercophora scortea]|uniref:Uncharacterized protein n=1 Tax=Cercophora scortea TaxID=314031 RepID=A0AAE0IEE5_9PEZI|nr:hypothetical protein B0T19DRAFT_442760 [Cercophora scortea]
MPKGEDLNIQEPNTGSQRPRYDTRSIEEFQKELRRIQDLVKLIHTALPTAREQFGLALQNTRPDLLRQIKEFSARLEQIDRELQALHEKSARLADAENAEPEFQRRRATQNDAQTQTKFQHLSQTQSTIEEEELSQTQFGDSDQEEREISSPAGPKTWLRPSKRLVRIRPSDDQVPHYTQREGEEYHESDLSSEGSWSTTVEPEMPSPRESPPASPLSSPTPPEFDMELVRSSIASPPARIDLNPEALESYIYLNDILRPKKTDLEEQLAHLQSELQTALASLADAQRQLAQQQKQAEKEKENKKQQREEKQYPDTPNPEYTLGPRVVHKAYLALRAQIHDFVSSPMLKMETDAPHSHPTTENKNSQADSPPAPSRASSVTIEGTEPTSNKTWFCDAELWNSQAKSRRRLREYLVMDKITEHLYKRILRPGLRSFGLESFQNKPEERDTFLHEAHLRALEAELAKRGITDRPLSEWRKHTIEITAPLVTDAARMKQVAGEIADILAPLIPSTDTSSSTSKKRKKKTKDGGVRRKITDICFDAVKLKLAMRKTAGQYKIEIPDAGGKYRYWGEVGADEETLRMSPTEWMEIRDTIDGRRGEEDIVCVPFGALTRFDGEAGGDDVVRKVVIEKAWIVAREVPGERGSGS